MSSSKVVKSSSSSSSSFSSSSSTKKVSTQSSSGTSSQVQQMSSSTTVKSSGAIGSGLDVDASIEQMKVRMDEQMLKMRQEMRMLLPASAGGGQLIKLDEKSIEQYFDDSHKRVKFDVDVQEFAKETVVVKSDGNKIEVHAKKFVKKGDDEHQEEYSRTYELPSGMDAKMVTSSMQKDGNLLTIELPV